MNCPRCTRELPPDSRFCPACGLDLELVRDEATPLPEDEIRDEALPLDEFEEEAAPLGDTMDEVDPWPRPLRLQPSTGPKRPLLAATLAFFFGPFAYLYLEQSAWFWWGLLGGLFLIVLSRAELLFLLVIGFTLHAYDVAGILNREHSLLEITSEYSE
jgi:hypothetical protein